MAAELDRYIVVRVAAVPDWNGEAEGLEVDEGNRGGENLEGFARVGSIIIRPSFTARRCLSAIAASGTSSGSSWIVW
jgi:hypothetical protein